MWKTPVLVLTLLINITNCVKLLSEGIDGMNINESRCVDHCLNTTSYYDCMGTCSSTWLFGGIGGASSCEEPNYNDANGTTCNPPSATFEIKTIFRRSLSGAVKEYFYFSWNPCSAAIDRLRGYWITLTFSSNVVAEKCYYLHLQKNNTPFQFSRTEHDVRMWFMPPDPLDSEKFYDVRIKSIPYSRNEGMLELRSKKTADCPSLNGRHSCFCEYDILDAPNITVLGYSVKVVFYPAPKCLSPNFYGLILCHVEERYCVDDGFNDNIDISQPQNDSIPIKHRFENVYDSSTKNLIFKLHLVYEHDKGPKTLYRYITIKAWSPPQPDITNRGSGEYEARFSLPPTNFRLPAYVFRISKCDRVNSSVKIVSILKDYVVNSSLAVDEILRQKLALKEGLYCVQIRELRIKAITKYFNEAKWGPIRTIEVKAPWSPPQPIITDRGSGEYEARFSLPPTNVVFPAYVFRISKCDRVNSSVKIVSVLKDYVVNSSLAVDGVLSLKFDLNDGLYCVQIRELRTKAITNYFDQAKWGPMKTIEVKAPGSNPYAIVIVAVSLTLIALSIVIFVSLLRAGHCSLQITRLGYWILKRRSNVHERSLSSRPIEPNLEL